MHKLLGFLQSKDGGAKTEKDASRTTTDVSKFLRFCASKLGSHLLDCNNVEYFLEKVREAGCGPETEKKFVMSIHHALNYGYVKLCRMKATDHQKLSAITVLQEHLAKLRYTLNKQGAPQSMQPDSWKSHLSLPR